MKKHSENDECGPENWDVFTFNMNRHRTVQTAKRKCLSVFCCIVVTDSDVDSLEFSMSCCEKRASRMSSVTLTEENWQRVKDDIPINITMEKFNDVLDKISVWVKAAVKEVFVPALQPSMEQNLLSSEMPSTSSSPHGVEHGETSTSPSERISQRLRDVFSSAFAGSPCCLPLMPTSPFRSSRKPLQNEASKPLMELRSEPEFMSTVKCSDLSTAPPCEPLRTLFGITKESIFHNVHREVINSLCNMKLPSMTDTARMKTTFKLASTILDQSLVQLNSALAELLDHADSHQASLFIANTRKDVANILLFVTVTRMQNFVHLCTASEWLIAAQCSSISKINDGLEEMLPTATAKVVATIFESMLNVCSEASSENPEEFGSKTPLYNFIQAVHDKIKSDLFKAATLRGSSSGTCSGIGRKSPSSPVSLSSTSSQTSWAPKAGRALLWLNEENVESTTVEDLPVNLVSFIGAEVPEVTSSVIYQSLQLEHYMRLKPPCERIMETIIFSVNDNDDPPTSETHTKGLFRLSCEAFHIEASKMVSEIILNETAELDMAREASKRSESFVARGDQSPPPAFKSSLGSSSLAAASTVVSAVTAELKSTFGEELRLVDLSVDSTVYTEQVQMVSEKVLNSTQARLKKVFLQNLLMRADAAATRHDRAALSYKILSGSKKVVKSIIQNITAIVPLSAASESVTAITQQFLKSLEEDLELQFLWQLSDSSLMRPECFSDLIVTEVSEAVADKLLSNGALQQNESSDSSLETLDNILSTDSIHQSSRELISFVQNLVLGASAVLNSVMEKISSPCGEKVVSTPELCEEKVQSGIVSGFIRTVTERLLHQCLDRISRKPQTVPSSVDHHHPKTASPLLTPELQTETENPTVTSFQASESQTARLADDLVNYVMESLPADLFKTSSCTSLGSTPSKTSKHHRILPFTIPKFRGLKLRFKKLRKKVEPMSAPSSDCTQKRPDLTGSQTVSSFCPPSEEPSKSLATTTSSAVPVPKRKTFFSRVATAVSKVFRTGSKISS